MSIIINFFGGPCIGKSTQSAELFTLMKKSHMNVELTFEYPKIVAWEENFSSIRDQFFITANTFFTINSFIYPFIIRSEWASLYNF